MSNVEKLTVGEAETVSTPATPAKISAVGIQMRFGDVTAVEDFTCDIREREFVSIIGPSGCGKSTMLYTIAGFL